jgi:hypothetical protein
VAAEEVAASLEQVLARALGPVLEQALPRALALALPRALVAEVAEAEEVAEEVAVAVVAVDRSWCWLLPARAGTAH